MNTWWKIIDQAIASFQVFCLLPEVAEVTHCTTIHYCTLYAREMSLCYLAKIKSSNTKRSTGQLDLSCIRSDANASCNHVRLRVGQIHTIARGATQQLENCLEAYERAPHAWLHNLHTIEYELHRFDNSFVFQFSNPIDLVIEKAISYFSIEWLWFYRAWQSSKLCSNRNRQRWCIFILWTKLHLSW